MDVDGGGRGFQRGRAVVVGDGVEELQVQDRADALHDVGHEASALAVGRVLVALGPAVGARDHLHAVDAQGVQLAEFAAGGDDFEVGVAGHEQRAVPGFEEIEQRVRSRISFGRRS